jgi:bis(5'-nucleosyl)-tetraphosphatase (symmetrical)
MAVYAIGDIQGCYDSLRRLLEAIKFDCANDRLWFTGDLVNRGTQSVATLRLVRELEPWSVTVLGNHDLHMLAVAAGVRKYRRNDTFADVLTAEDGSQLLDWLRERPLFHLDTTLGYCLVHAGVLPSWSVEESQRLADEVGEVLRGAGWVRLMETMYGNEPCLWTRALKRWARYRVVINVMTRMRFVDESGRLDFSHKGPPGTQPPGWSPWFEHRQGLQQRIVFGHWSALGARVVPNGICLDSGCVWGGELTAVRLDADQLEFHRVDCKYPRLE